MVQTHDPRVNAMLVELAGRASHKCGTQKAQEDRVEERATDHAHQGVPFEVEGTECGVSDGVARGALDELEAHQALAIGDKDRRLHHEHLHQEVHDDDPHGHRASVEPDDGADVPERHRAEAADGQRQDRSRELGA